MKLKKRVKEEKVSKPKVAKGSYPKSLDEIEFAIQIGVTHADNEGNNQFLLGEKDMLAKVKELLPGILRLGS